MAYAPRQLRLLGILKSADMNSTADQAIPILNSTKYLIKEIIATNVSTTLGSSLAAGGVYPTTSKGGTAIVAAGQVYTALTAASKTLSLTLAVTADTLSAAILYLSLTVANGSAATADFYIFGYDLS